MICFHDTGVTYLLVTSRYPFKECVAPEKDL